MPDLELVPTADLIDELTGRSTFLGVVIVSERELKGAWDTKRSFLVHQCSSLKMSETIRLLETVAQVLAGRETTDS